MWNLPEAPTPSDLDRAIEEAIWFSTIMLVGPNEPSQNPRFDFFLMHDLTYSFFLRPLCKNVVKDTKNQARLIRHWLAAALTVLIVRGRPQLSTVAVIGYAEMPLPPNYVRSFSPNTR
jgi:hypothetical protein